MGPSNTTTQKGKRKVLSNNTAWRRVAPSAGGEGGGAYILSTVWNK